jgi:hypothetical protein
MSDDNDYGVEIRDVDHGGRTGERNTLYVDGDEVWIDWCSEPEDICLHRDLSVFVYTLRALAKDRHDARVELGAAEQARDALREENARLRAALRGLFKPDGVPYAQWTREMHAAHIALEGQ